MTESEQHALEALIALTLREPPPPTDAEIEQFIREYDAGMHRLSAEDEAALEGSFLKFREELRKLYEKEVTRD